MGIFKEIEKELVEVPEHYKVPIENFFQVCQEYYWNYQISEKCEEQMSVLQNYLEDEECIAGRIDEINSKRMKSLNICYKLHIEFIWNVYKQYYEEKFNKETEKYFFCEIVENNNRKEKIKEMLGENVNEDLIWYIDESISRWVEYIKCNKIKDLNLDKVHNAMKKTQSVLSLDKPTIEESVEDIIEPLILEEVLVALKTKNYPRALFLVAPITRAITDGAISTFTPKNKGKVKYFTVNFLYNLTILSKRISGLKRISEDYYETRDILKRDWMSYIEK